MPEWWPLPVLIAVFLASTAVIAYAGSRISEAADNLADKTGLGEAFVGAVLLGASTSIPGIIATINSATAGQPAFALSHAVGGIAVQTVFLSVADLTYRKGNLEHAAASAENLSLGALLLLLLSLLQAAVHMPGISVLGVHPVSILLVVSYVAGIRLIHKDRQVPMWRPSLTRNTREDRPDAGKVTDSLPSLTGRFLASASALASAGLGISESGVAIGNRTGISQTVMGGALATVLTAVLLFGLMRRERKGILNIGLESFLVPLLYAAGIAFLSWGLSWSCPRRPGLESGYPARCRRGSAPGRGPASSHRSKKAEAEEERNRSGRATAAGKWG